MKLSDLTPGTLFTLPATDRITIPAECDAVVDVRPWTFRYLGPLASRPLGVCKVEPVGCQFTLPLTVEVEG